MEEKVLIKSKLNKKWKFYTIFTLLGLTTLICLFIIPLITINEYKSWGYSVSFVEVLVNLPIYCTGGAQFVLAIISQVFLGLAVITPIVFLALEKCELQITEKHIMGKDWFGKKVFLPISQISAYSTRRFLSVVSIATSSGFTKFALISNYEEIGNVLQNLINQRQDATKFTANNSMENHNNLDDLKKLKELLDNGIISPEEFEAKKKQILGL